jgi:hypothetical protein
MVRRVPFFYYNGENFTHKSKILESNMENSFYVDALQNYLNGSEWKDTMRVFIAANCPFFSNIREFHPQQNLIWKSFQDVAESIIQTMLVEMGGSIEELEKAFDVISHQPSRGPKDDVTKDVIQQLSSVDDFEVFAGQMHKACKELFDEMGGDIHDNIYDAVMRMGFTVNDINEAMQSCSKDPTLEDVLIYITSKQANEQSQADQRKSKTHKTKSPKKKPKLASNPLEKFIFEAKTDNIHIDYNELNALFTIADSVLDAHYQSGSLAANALDDSNEELMLWAVEMKHLYHDLELAFEQELSCKDVNFHWEEGLISYYQHLEEKRQIINHNEEQGHHQAAKLLSDNELRRIAMLDEIAAMGTEGEQRLHQLLSRHELVRKEIASLYRKCSIYLTSHPNLQRDQVEQIYLYLKQQLSNGDNDNFDTGLTENSANPEQEPLVNMLLDIHILEDEQAMLRREIYEILGSEVAAAMEQEEGMKDIDSKGISFEEKMHIAERKFAGTEFDEDDAEAKAFATSQTRAESKEEGNRKEKDRSERKEGKEEAKNDNRNEPNVSSNQSGVSKTSTGFIATEEDTRKKESFINQLKDQHKQALNQLKSSLDHDRTLRLNRLEARLQALREHKASKEVIEEVERERQNLFDTTEIQKEAVVQGFKQRCLAELKTARQLLADPSLSPGIDDFTSLQSVLMNTNQQDQINGDALAALRKQYEQTTQSLQQQLHNQRSMSQDRLQARLRSKVILDAWEQAQQSAMLAIAAVNDPDLLVQQVPSKQQGKIQVDDADMDYLNEDEDSLLKREEQQTRRIRALQRMSELQREYAKAARLLRDRLIDEQIDEEDSSNQLESLQTADTLMLSAFEGHMKELQSDQSLLDDQSGMHERMKAGMLEAFEKAKVSLQQRLDNDKQSGQSRLQHRLQQRKQQTQASTASHVQLEAALEGAMEEVFQALDSPVFADNDKENQTSVRQIVQQNQKYQQLDNNQHEKDRIKQAHISKQQELVRSLSKILF